MVISLQSCVWSGRPKTPFRIFIHLKFFCSLKPSRSSRKVNLKRLPLPNQSHNLYITGEGPTSSSVKWLSASYMQGHLCCLQEITCLNFQTEHILSLLNKLQIYIDLNTMISMEWSLSMIVSFTSSSTSTSPTRLVRCRLHFIPKALQRLEI